MSCPDCFKGFVHPHGTPTGHEAQLHGHRTYIATPTAPSRSTILFITDAFGLELVNNKLLADRLCRLSGSRVVMPDIIPGGPASILVMACMETLLSPAPGGRWDIRGQLLRLLALFQALAIALPYILLKHPAKAYPRILAYARCLKREEPDVKLGAVGYCWGGYGSVRLCTEAAEPGGNIPLLDAQFNAHPSFLRTPDVVVDAVRAFNVPFASALGAKDFLMGAKEAARTEARLRSVVGESSADTGPAYELRVFAGCGHGFAIRPFPDSKVEVEAGEQAALWAGEWFGKYLA